MELRSILLVDDEEDLRTIGELSLGSVGGWKVLVAGSGPEAIEVAAQSCPDLILLDVLMPTMDGPTTLGQLRRQEATSHIPVAFMTAKTSEADLTRYAGLGAVGVIAKPFDPMTLPEQVRRLVASL